MTFSATWNTSFEATPADSENASQGASRIRALKLAISERGAIDHIWGGASDASSGEHKKVTFNAPISSPTNVTDKGFLFTKDVSSKAELHWLDEDGNEIQLTSAGALSAGAALLAATNVFTQRQTWTKGVDIASAGTLALGTDGNYFDVTGTTTITAITVPAGTLFMLQFDSTPQLTHHATNLNLPTGANITAAAGDRLIGFATAANQVIVVSYTRASGIAVGGSTAATQAEQEAGTATGNHVTSAIQHHHSSSAKLHASFDTSGSLQESYNTDSVTDSGTGDFTLNITNDFSSIEYCVIVSLDVIQAGNPPSIRGHCEGKSVGAIDIAVIQDSEARSESRLDRVEIVAFGDL